MPTLHDDHCLAATRHGASCARRRWANRGIAATTHPSLLDVIPSQVVLEGLQVSPPLSCRPFFAFLNAQSEPQAGYHLYRGGGAEAGWWLDARISPSVLAGARSLPCLPCANMPCLSLFTNKPFSAARWPIICLRKNQDTESTQHAPRKQDASGPYERLPIIHYPFTY